MERHFFQQIYNLNTNYQNRFIHFFQMESFRQQIKKQMKNSRSGSLFAPEIKRKNYKKKNQSDSDERQSRGQISQLQQYEPNRVQLQAQFTQKKWTPSQEMKLLQVYQKTGNKFIDISKILTSSFKSHNKVYTGRRIQSKLASMARTGLQIICQKITERQFEDPQFPSLDLNGIQKRIVAQSILTEDDEDSLKMKAQIIKLNFKKDLSDRTLLKLIDFIQDTINSKVDKIDRGQAVPKKKPRGRRRKEPVQDGTSLSTTSIKPVQKQKRRRRRKLQDQDDDEDLRKLLQRDDDPRVSQEPAHPLPQKQASVKPKQQPFKPKQPVPQITTERFNNFSIQQPDAEDLRDLADLTQSKLGRKINSQFLTVLQRYGSNMDRISDLTQIKDRKQIRKITQSIYLKAMRILERKALKFLDPHSQKLSTVAIRKIAVILVNQDVDQDINDFRIKLLKILKMLIQGERLNANQIKEAYVSFVQIRDNTNVMSKSLFDNPHHTITEIKKQGRDQPRQVYKDSTVKQPKTYVIKYPRQNKGPKPCKDFLFAGNTTFSKGTPVAKDQHQPSFYKEHQYPPTTMNQSLEHIFDLKQHPKQKPQKSILKQNSGLSASSSSKSIAQKIDMTWRNVQIHILLQIYAQVKTTKYDLLGKKMKQRFPDRIKKFTTEKVEQKMLELIAKGLQTLQIILHERQAKFDKFGKLQIPDASRSLKKIRTINPQHILKADDQIYFLSKKLLIRIIFDKNVKSIDIKHLVLNIQSFSSQEVKMFNYDREREKRQRDSFLERERQQFQRHQFGNLHQQKKYTIEQSKKFFNGTIKEMKRQQVQSGPIVTYTSKQITESEYRKARNQLREKILQQNIQKAKMRENKKKSKVKLPKMLLGSGFNYRDSSSSIGEEFDDFV